MARPGKGGKIAKKKPFMLELSGGTPVAERTIGYGSLPQGIKRLAHSLALLKKNPPLPQNGEPHRQGTLDELVSLKIRAEIVSSKDPRIIILRERFGVKHLFIDANGNLTFL